MVQISKAGATGVASKSLSRLAICACILIAACSSTPTVPNTDAGEIQSLRISRVEVLVPGPVPQALFRDAGEWRVSSGQQWGFAAFAPFDGFGIPGVKGTVEVQLRVTKGQIGVGLLTDQSDILQEKIVEVTPEAGKLSFDLGSANLESIVFRSAAASGTVSEAVIHAIDYLVQGAAILNAASLQKIVKVDPAAGLDPGPPARISTGQKYGFAAHLPLAVPALGNSLAFVRVRGKISEGRIGIAILEGSGTVAKNERFYDVSPDNRDYFVVISNPDRAESVMFRSDKAEKSEIVVEDVSVFRLM